MKAAFSIWNHRIAPVFDVSDRIVLVECNSGKIIHQEEKILPNDLPVQVALRLAETKTQMLICGAISRGMHTIINSYGISVIPFVSGDLGEVIDAWLSGRTDWSNFAMPGCKGYGRRRSGGRGSGFGHTRPIGRGNGRGSENTSVNKAYCICPQCGFRQPHQRGNPCMNNPCPDCGTKMRRENL